MKLFYRLLGIGCLTLLLGGCLSLTPGGEGVKIVDNREDLYGCTGRSTLWASSIGQERTMVLARNEAAEAGGNTLLRDSMDDVWFYPEFNGKIYSCN